MVFQRQMPVVYNDTKLQIRASKQLYFLFYALRKNKGGENTT